MTDAARADAVLEALSLERKAAGARFFEDLFLRFQRRVASETLTRPAGAPAAFDAKEFFAEWLEEERGLAGEERALAFAWLARQLGFEAALVRGESRRPWDDTRDGERLPADTVGFSSKMTAAAAHRAVIASIGDWNVLADAGFPLPVLLPLDSSSREFPTGLGTLTVKSAAGGDDIRVTCDARGEETELLRLGHAPNPPALPPEETSRPSPEASPRHGASGSKDPFALRVLDDRVLHWRAGRMTILDAWSRLSYPLPFSERAAIEKIFALDLGGVSLPEEPRPEAPEPSTLSVFHLSPVPPDEACSRVGRDAVALLLVSSREERVEAAPGGSLITIRATLADVPPAGPTEAVRKTLVFHLVSELFELSRGDGKTV